MRRFLLVFVAIALIAGGAFAQSVGSTWYDPQDPMNEMFPSSLPNYTTSGIFADEIDYVFRAPSMLGNYAGYSVVTAYGNYEVLPTGSTWVSPFDTTALDYGPGSDEIGYYQLGATFPVLEGIRAGSLVGHAYELSGNVLGGLRRNEGSETVVTDGFTLGEIDNTEVDSYATTDELTESTTAFLAGVSLGELGLSDLGVSLLFFNDGTSRSIGGSRTLTWTDGPDTADAEPADQTTDESVYYGYGETGNPAGYAGFGRTAVAALGQATIASFPVFSAVMLDWEANPLDDTLVRRTYSESIGWVTAAGGAESDVTTRTMTSADDLSGGWSASDGFPVWVPEPGNSYIDPTGSADGTFTVGLTLGTEPEFQVADALAFRTKGALVLMNESDRSATTVRASSTASDATTADTNDEWSYDYSGSGSTTENTFTVAAEIGGIAELSDANDIVTLGVGFFASPSIGFGSVAWEDAVTTINRSWAESTGAATAITLGDVQPVAFFDLQTAAELIEHGGAFNGESTYTETVSYDSNGSALVTSLDMDIPVAVRFDLFDGALQPFFGYTIRHSGAIASTTMPASTTTESLVVTDGTSTVFDSSDDGDYPPAESEASTTSSSSITSVVSSRQWFGQMGWGLRWVPVESLTIDVEGGSIMAALDTLGFNDFRLDDLLRMDISATFRF
ncbi:MAG: hypothetical protein ACOCZB_01015 [Spirochaetota bacterium]